MLFGDSTKMKAMVYQLARHNLGLDDARQNAIHIESLNLGFRPEDDAMPQNG